MCKPSITYYYSFVTRFVKKHKKGRKAPYFLIFIGHPSHSGDLLRLVFVRRRASCGVRRAWTFYIFNFLKILLQSWLKHLFDTRNLNCDVHGSTIPEGHMRGKICKKSRISIIYSTPTHVRKKLDAWLWFPCNPKLWKSWPMGQWFKL